MKGHNDSSGFSKWEDAEKRLVCLFVEDKQMDVWVMQVLLKKNFTLTPHLGVSQVPMLIILVFNTLFLIWVILVRLNFQS